MRGSCFSTAFPSRTPQQPEPGEKKIEMRNPDTIDRAEKEMRWPDAGNESSRA